MAQQAQQRRAVVCVRKRVLLQQPRKSWQPVGVADQQCLHLGISDNLLCDLLR
jgi:hypothetical protein